MGTKRVRERYDVHCMECGRSYETTRYVEKCTFKCGSENIICEENSKYVMETIFPGRDHLINDRGFDYHTIQIPGYQ